MFYLFRGIGKCSLCVSYQVQSLLLWGVFTELVDGKEELSYVLCGGMRLTKKLQIDLYILPLLLTDTKVPIDIFQPFPIWFGKAL